MTEGLSIAGVDGCRAGWVAIAEVEGGPPHMRVASRFDELADGLPDNTIFAVDMPIGLPERIGLAGRGPEMLVRRHLGPRQSSVFAIPSRAAIYAETAAFTTLDAWYASHRRASAVARDTSDPPRAIAIQAFGIFGKIRELDILLRERLALAARVHEAHPELAFWRLNGGRAMSLPKKIKSRVNPAGMAERRALLVSHGLPHGLFDQALPVGVGADDHLDAAALLLIARRIALGEAVPFPDPPQRDEYGLPIAIWA